MNTPQTIELNISELKPEKCHLIEANAGTGKTYAIANLFLRFILEGHKANSILVVTFTNAARDELRGRLRKRLVQAQEMFKCGNIDSNEDDFFKSLPDTYPIDSAQEKTASLNLELALLSMNEAAIHTIHGFCQQTLNDNAVSSNQQFDIEQTDDRQIKKEAIQDWWRKRTYDFTKEKFQWFQSNIFKDIDQLEKMITPLLDVNAPALHIPEGIEQSSLDDLQSAIDEILSKVCKEWTNDNKRIRSRLIDKKQYKLRNSKPYKEDAALVDFFSLISSINENRTKENLNAASFAPYGYQTLSNKLNKGGNKEDFDLPFFQLIDRLHIHLKEGHLLSNIHRASKDIRQQIAKYKLDNGLLSFDDMIENLHIAVCKQDKTSKLATTLAEQYPLIMVDEFQDTDPKQYEIFHDIYKAGKKSTKKNTLIMIGDPKQAIYSFRGGDIFTYMQAQDDADQVWTLSTNWRSTPEMIQAFNHVFARNNAFTYDAIGYHNSLKPPKDKQNANALFIDGAKQAAMIFEEIPKAEDGTVFTTKADTHEQIHAVTAERIAQLLANNTSKIGKNVLKPGDIAVLVREKTEASALQEKLLKYGIRAVSISDESVWNTDEATSLILLIKAIAAPDDRNASRRALGAPVIGLNIEEIYKIMNTPVLWSSWIEDLFATHEIWLKKGFMAAYQSLLHNICDIVNEDTDEQNHLHTETWLSRCGNPERMLTNITHLGELLQQASLKYPGMEGLVAWMQQQKNEQDQNQADKEETQLRLESDEKLVKMITIHKSKGLQYPVVFLPYMWHCKPKDSRGTKSIALNWHEPADTGYQSFFTPDCSNHDQMFFKAEHERLAEDVRLAYVALTRAESHCYVFFGPNGTNSQWKGDAGQTGLAWLLSKPDGDYDFNAEAFKVDPETISLARLKDCDAIRTVSPQPTSDNIDLLSITTQRTPLSEPSKFSRQMYNNWRISSFSSMSQAVHQTTRSKAKTSGDTFALKFAAGAHVGNFLHALLEHIKTDMPLREQLEKIVPYHAIHYNVKISDEDMNGLENWLSDILGTPLDDSDLTLGGIKPEHQLHELEFDFSTTLVGYKNLHQYLSEYAGTELTKLDFQAFEGIVNGIIDLVFEYQGRYYLADYKSNLLGRELDDYTPEILQTEIHNRRYDLQYLIYTLALHRHLKQRLGCNYNYDDHFGGAYYLFLRAMTPSTGAKYGVFFDRPPRAIIDQLDLDIFAIPDIQEAS